MREAFILIGGTGVLCRTPRYATELRSRGLDVLFVTPELWRPLVETSVQRPGHILRELAEITFVSGEMSVEGAFTADVIARAMAWRRTYDIRGVLPIGEILVEPAGLLADALGLPSPGLRATRVCRSKYLQRWYLPEISPAALLLPPGGRQLAGSWAGGFPAVLKPTGRFASSGVRAVDSPEALGTALAGYPPHESLLVEHRVSGQEYSVETLVQHGTVVFSSVTRKETTESGADTFVEMSHTQPEVGTPAERTLQDLQRRMLRQLDWRDGIVHAEWRVDGTGRGWLMEVAARPPGDAILPLYELATGRSLVPAMIDIALGEPATHPAPRRHARQVYLPQHPSVLRGVRHDWPDVACHWLTGGDPWPELAAGAPDDPPALRAVLVTKPVGATLAAPAHSDDRAVSILVDAPAPELLDRIETEAVRALTIEIEEPPR